MQPHLKRAFTVIAVVIIVFIVVRTITLPPSFGEYGWYRGNAVDEIKDETVNYAGSQSCNGENCHSGLYSIWNQSRHKTINCETCHGPSKRHVDNVRIMPEPAVNTRDGCGLCHYKQVSRPKDFPQIDPSVHGNDMVCTYCHNAHKPWFV